MRASHYDKDGKLIGYTEETTGLEMIGPGVTNCGRVIAVLIAVLIAQMMITVLMAILFFGVH